MSRIRSRAAQVCGLLSDILPQVEDRIFDLAATLGPAASAISMVLSRWSLQTAKSDRLPAYPRAAGAAVAGA